METEKDLTRRIAVFTEMTQRLTSKKPELTKSNPHQWAGMGEDGTILFANDIEELVHKMKDGKEKGYVTTVTYLEPNPPPFSLAAAQ